MYRDRSLRGELHQGRLLTLPMKPRVRKIRDHYLVSTPETGAVSLFSPAEYYAFKKISGVPLQEKEITVRKVLEEVGCTGETAGDFIRIFMKKLAQQGWLREHRLEEDPGPLQHVYLSVTTRCNLSCLYCYIGDEHIRSGNEMDAENASIILTRLRNVSPRAKIAVTGGEPFTHPDIFTIMDLIGEHGFSFVTGTNATLIDDFCARKLGTYRNLKLIQVSIDGISPGTHCLTRGNSFQSTMTGIMNLIKHKVPFSLAPTLHEGNLYEMEELARFACRNGGQFAPNHLRKFPHAPRANLISLKQASLRRTIIDTFEKINREFDLSGTGHAAINADLHGTTRDICSKYVCGNGWSTIDINWNGDVYPCHLLREKEFIIGNILEEEFEAIFSRSRNSSTRTRSYEIPKCKNCPFVATCAGGCRASSFYTHGTFAAEDEFCEILYKFEVDKLFQSKDIPFHL